MGAPPIGQDGCLTWTTAGSSALARLRDRCYCACVSFFGIGPMEMVVIAVVALMLFNPRELPKMLRSVAKFWGQLRATADEFKDTIMTADGVDEIQELVKGTKGQIRQVETDARRELMKARAEMRKAQQKLIKANQAKLQQKQQEIDAQKADGDDAESSPGGDSDDAVSAGTDADGDIDDGPVASTAPHDRKPAASIPEADSEPSPPGDDPPSGDDAHNQGAA